MRAFRILSLIFVLAALFFGAIQLFYRMQHMPADLTLGSLLQNIAIDAGALVSRLPGGAAQDVAATIMQVPAWLASLCLAGVLWLAGSVLDDGEG